MKKTYMQPFVEVVMIKQEAMLDSSPLSFGGDYDGKAAIEARDRYDFDDDDDDLGSIIPW